MNNFHDDLYLEGKTDGWEDHRKRVADALTTARRNETDPNVHAALDKLAKHLGLTVVTEVRYTS